MFASMLGFILSGFLLLFLLFGLFASIASLATKETVAVSEKTVLHITLSEEIVDRGGRNPFEDFDFMSFSSPSAIGLNELIKELKKAKEDENIEGIFLDLTALRTGWASSSEIRQALLDFKESEKFIISYGEAYTQNAYYLATVADEIYLHPEGAVDFRGLNGQALFIKNMLDKLGIDPQVIRHGKYKSAGEMFFLEQMSPENREQMLAYISSIWNNVLGDIAEARGLSLNRLNEVADAFNTRNAELALDNQMVDGIKYIDQVREIINEKLEQEHDADINFITFSKYKNAPMPKGSITPRSRDKIAVVYASGNILPGEGSEGTIGTNVSKALREARQDSTIKAIVLRINSGGGSALVSDVILREIILATEVKPVIASMGDVAASGGYYIACAADMIMANPNTITGSIGVFGIIPNMQDFFNNKLGITFDNVKTNEFADLASIHRPLSTREREIIQESIERVYETFIGHVADGRNMPVDLVDDLGQGRVWSGAEARQNGLIDEFGGLDDAIEKAAEMADLETYRIIELPERKELFAKLMEDFGGIQEKMIERRLGAAYHYYKQVEELNQMTGILARMPYDVIIE